MQSWYCTGNFPYRDFYYYLPPLNILIDVMLWKLSFGSLFIYRAWWLVQRIAIYELMFRLLCRYFNRYAAFAACAFSAILCTASVYDLFGDYNQTIPFLSVLLLYCVLGFAEAADKKAAGKYLFAAGAMLGLLFLNKQTIFCSCGGYLSAGFECLLLEEKRTKAFCNIVRQSYLAFCWCSSWPWESLPSMARCFRSFSRSLCTREAKAVRLPFC